MYVSKQIDSRIALNQFESIVLNEKSDSIDYAENAARTDEISARSL